MKCIENIQIIEYINFVTKLAVWFANFCSAIHANAEPDGNTVFFETVLLAMGRNNYAD